MTTLAISPDDPFRGPAIRLWAVIVITPILAVLLGGLIQLAFGVIVLALTAGALRLAHASGPPTRARRWLVAATVVSFLLILFSTRFLLFMLFWREWGRTPQDVVGLHLFFPAVTVTALALLSVPMTRRTAWERFSRGAAWGGATLVFIALALQQFATAGL